MMTLDEAIAKATKLLRLSESTNANESAAAAQMAQKILARYNIDRAALAVNGDSDGPEEAIEDHDQPLDDGGKRLASWKSVLANNVAKANSCRAYTRGSTIGLVGRPSDVAKIRYLYDLLAREVDRLTATYGKGWGRSYCSSFRMGVVTAIGDKLQEANAKVANEIRAEHFGTALVRIVKALQRVSDRDDAVDDWIDENMNLRSSYRTSRINPSAEEDGYAAGRTIHIGGARGALDCGQNA